MKKKILFIILFIIICLPVSAYGASVSVALSCPTTAKASSTVSCTVSATPSGSNLKGLQANFSITNGSYASFTVANGWSTYSNSSSGFSLGRNTEVTSKVTVGTLKLKMPASGSLVVKLTNVSGTDASYQTLSGNTPQASIRVQSNTNTLSSLSLSNGTLSPVFDSNTSSYTSTINATSTVISATATDSQSKITGNGTKSLNYGTNKFNIVVTSESGVKRTYTITITRPDNRSNNNNLSSLKVSSGNLSFNKNTLSYNVSVDSNVTSIKVDASLEDSKASFVSGFGPRNVNLNYGNNAIQIKVKAENQSIKTYTINVNRKDSRSNNNYLSNLTLSSGTITFNKNTLTYNISVPFETTKINVTATTEDPKAKVVVNSPNLIEGDNTITITVTAENGQNRVYKILVKRLPKAATLSDNNNITSLKILGRDVDFKNDVLEYNVSIKEEYALVFEIVLEDPKATYQIIGNEDLKDGSIITVTVTSESGKKKEYKFNISKEIQEVQQPQEEKQVNGLLYGIVGFVVGCIVTIIVTGVFKGKKDKDVVLNTQNPNIK